MPETIEEYYARVMAAVDDEGRLAIPVDGIPNWETLPFEPAGLRLKPLAPLAEVEAPRLGEDPTKCRCAGPQPDDQWVVWTDDHWKIELFEESGAPLILMLSPQAHHDFTALPQDRAAERHDDGGLGRLPAADTR